MVLSWNDWWLAHNALGHPTDWDPAANPAHMVRAEVNDIYKAMTKIRALEAKLKNSKGGDTNYDWNLLNSLKREVGIAVEFPGDNATALAGEGDIPSKAVAANM